MDRQPAPNYTTAFLVSLIPIVLVALIAIWATTGFIAALGIGYVADKGIRRVEDRRQL